MKFVESTHCKRWILNSEQLSELRTKSREASIATLNAQLDPDQTSSLDFLSPEEEQDLIRYYENKVAGMCRELRLPPKVISTSLIYLKRYYSQNSVINCDPQRLSLTCLYLACKIEEFYISAGELERLTGVPAEIMLRTELTLLQGLQFDLIVFSPYKALKGFWWDIKNKRDKKKSGNNESSNGSDDDVVMLTCDQQATDGGMTRATSIIDELLLTDIPLMYPPGVIALAALCIGFYDNDEDGKWRYATTVADSVVSNHSSSGGEGEGKGEGKDVVRSKEELMEALKEVERYVKDEEKRRVASKEEVSGLDRRLKAVTKSKGPAKKKQKLTKA